MIHGVVPNMVARTLMSLVLAMAACSAVRAQPTGMDTAEWLGREFRYWQGLPMMHGPDGECIAGYTDEERLMVLFPDHQYQEIIFEDGGSAGLRIWQPGDCAPLQGDTVAVLTGTWAWTGDTLRVTVERTAIHPLEVVTEHYWHQRWTAPMMLPVAPVRECHSERDRSFWFKDGRLEEAMRRWD